MSRLRVLLAVVFASVPASRLAAEEPTSHTFEAKGVKIRYITAGQGEPVVLLHGLYASADLNWRLPGIFAELAKDHRVIALDFPGHGQSDKPDREEAYGAQLAEDVVLLLDHLKIDKAHIVGYSLGGMVTMKLLTKHPERVRSAVLGGMGWLKEGSPLAGIWDKMGGKDKGRFLSTPSSFVKSMGKLAVTESEVKAIRVPVTVIIGDGDPVKKMYVEPLRVVRDDWPVVEIAGAGHLTCVAKPQFRDEIAAWLKKKEK